MSSPDGGSSPRDDLYSLECQRRLRKLDEPQRQVPSEDLVSWTATWEDESSAQTAGSSGQRRTAPPTEPGFSQGFFFILSPMEFWFLAVVDSGLLSLGLLISCDIIDLIAQILKNWTELDDDITEFNDELPLTENWVFTIVLLHYLHTIFLFDIVKLLWHNICIVKSAI